MSDAARTAPATTGIHHFSPTVKDVERSAAWYQKVFGLDRLQRMAPHYGDEEGGYAVLLVDPRTGFLVGLHHHTNRTTEAFDERAVGLDHIAWNVPSRTELERWAAWLDEMDVRHSGIIEMSAAGYAAIVLRDPDGIQLELFHRGG